MRKLNKLPHVDIAMSYAGLWGLPLQHFMKGS